MNLLFIVLMSLISAAIEGNFTFKGEHQLLQAQRFEVVYPASTPGKARLQELLNLGYTCQPKLQFYQCTATSAESTVPQNISAQITKSEVIFGPVKSVTPIAQGDHLLQYEADQNVSVDGINHKPVIYLETATQIKVTVGDPTSSEYHSFVVYKDAVGKVDSYQAKESPWAFKKYVVETKFTRDY